MSNEGRILVVDQGSTTSKAALVGPGGEILAERSHRIERRVEGRSVTHDPVAVAESVERLIAELASGQTVAAIGLTCQRSTCLLWDADSGEPLTPALSWQDTSQFGRIEQLGGAARTVAERTGLMASPHYAASKLAALIDDLPRGAERAASGEIVAGTLDAFLARRLTGRDSTEPGHAGRTLLYDLDEDRWSPELCELFGVPPAALPEILPSAAPRGEHHGVPLVAAAGDQQAALLGHGGWIRGRLVAHFGTGAFVLASTGREVRRHAGLLSAVLASTPEERRLQLEGSVNSAGSAVDWACRLAGREIASHPDRTLDPESLPMLIPAFTGLAAPWWRPMARALITGLSLEVGPDELIDATLCGVAMRVLDCVEELQAAKAIERGSPLRVSGKLTRHQGLVGLLADAGQRPVEVSLEEESGLEGLRRLVLAATGRPEALEEPPAAATVREPAWPEERARRVRGAWRQEIAELA